MFSVLAVAVGGFAGGFLRAELSRLSTPRLPIGTASANVVACFLLGFAHLAPWGSFAILLLATGVAGALSTMSTFIKELVNLGWIRGTVYATLTMMLGALALWLAQFLAHQVF